MGIDYEVWQKPSYKELERYSAWLTAEMLENAKERNSAIQLVCVLLVLLTIATTLLVLTWSGRIVI